MATVPSVITPDEYLRRERSSEQKHEYSDGRMFAMAGASREHRKIMNNILVFLIQSAKGSICAPDNSETRLFIPANGRYTYADVVMTCGEQQYQDDQLDTLLNPTLIVEILSPTTEAYDRGKKFPAYRSIPTFSEYLLVAQDETMVEYYLRQQDRQWTHHFYQERAESVELHSSGISLPLEVIYEGLPFISA